MQPPVRIGSDLTITVGSTQTRVTPSEGLRLAELLTRASFRTALAEEADAHSKGRDAVATGSDIVKAAPIFPGPDQTEPTVATPGAILAAGRKWRGEIQ